MSLLIGPYEFDGPLINRLGVKPEAGIYAILSFARQDFELLELAESDNLQADLLKTENLEYWQRKSHGMLAFSVYYSPFSSAMKRREMVNQMLLQFKGEWHKPHSQRELELVPC
ncbi:MAG: hypothetical protein K2X81_26380 [Candidatus Obscuribacterales bacterium]|nr:hypothetical protein [Candidatus Obscuribacterales bacterium]